MAEKSSEGYFAIGAFLSLISTLLIHYFFIAQFGFHSTLHVGIGLVIFAVLNACFSFVLGKLW